MSLKRFLPLVLVAALIAACGAEEPTDVSDETEDPGPVSQGQTVVSATGEVVPVQEATLSFSSAGQLVELNIEVGDVVQEGDLLASLDTTQIDAQIAAAEAAVIVAEASLDQVRAGPRPAQIDEQEANVAAAAANTGVAAGSRNDTADGPTDTQIAQQQAAVQQAFIEYWNARTERDYLRYRVDNPENAFEDFILTENLVDDAQQTLDFAILELETAQAQLEQLLAGPNQDQLAAANADVAAAAADQEAAQAQLEALEAGATEEAIAAAEAAVDQAEAALEQVRVQRDNTMLEAPFNGTVSELFLLDAQYVQPGVPALTIADLTDLVVETTDLNEIDIAQVEVGDTAIITFDALPGVEIEGTVIEIAPKADEGTGVNFRVTIELNEMPDRLRWGMTAFVDIPVDQ